MTIYARNPSKLPLDVSDNLNVTVIKGELNNLDAIKEALKTGAEVLVSFLGPAVPARGVVSLRSSFAALRQKEI